MVKALAALMVSHWAARSVVSTEPQLAEKKAKNWDTKSVVLMAEHSADC